MTNHQDKPEQAEQNAKTGAPIVGTVARAIYESRNGPGCKPWSIQTKAHKEPYLSDARAAIEAMREPTPEMYRAAYYVENGKYLRGDEDPPPKVCWRAMIDAALKPEVQP